MKKHLASAAILLATCSFTFAQGAGGAGAAGGGGAGGSGTGGPGTGGTGGAGSGTGTGAPGTGAQGSTSGTGSMGGYTQTPWFADQNARQQLGISNDQFNQLNKAYTNYWRDINSGANKAGNTGTGGTGTSGTGGTGTGGAGVGASGTGASGTGQTSPTQKSNAVANFGQQTSKAAQDILKPEQYNRFRQMDLQSRGWHAFSDPDVQKKMNFTDQQREQLQLYQTRWNQSMNQVYSSNDQNRDSAMKAYQDARQQYAKQMQQFLTPEQRQTWAQMTGDPYEFRPYWDQTKQPATQQSTTTPPSK